MPIKEKLGKTAGKIKGLLHTEAPHEVDMAGKVGETAGKVWQRLHEGGPQTLAQVTKAVKEPTDVVRFAVGWLAREEKLTIAAEAKGFRLTLR